MPAARITPSLSGRDRKHYAGELHKAEVAYEREMGEAAEARAAADRLLAKAHDLHFIAWTTRQFIGGDDAPSLSVADAINGQHSLLEVRCPSLSSNQDHEPTLVVCSNGDSPGFARELSLGCCRAINNQNLSSRGLLGWPLQVRQSR